MNRYYNPVRTLEGPGCLRQLPQVLEEMTLPQRKVLVLAWSQQALEHPAVAALLGKESGVEAKSLVFTASNPTVEQLFQVWRETTAFAPEVVVAIGGGSVLDVGKSLCCLYGRELESLQALREAITDGKLHPAAQWIGVPTTAGTGSEVTCWATIWDPEQNCKRSLESQENYAYAALVDPELAQGMPVQLAVSSALMLPPMRWSYWANPQCCVRGLALEAIVTVMGELTACWKMPRRPRSHGPRQPAGRAGIYNTKTTACHSISYPLTMRYHIPHGTAVALLLAPVLELNAPAVPGLDRLFHALGVEDAAGLHARVRDLLERSGQSSTLQGWGVRQEDLPRLAALGMTKGRADNNPVALDSGTIETLLRSIYE
ncbi:MAG: phosphonoacetaldehyde reductase [Acutalibacter sp.]